MNRFCAVIEIKDEYVKDYADIHKNCWPELLQAIRDSGCDNLTIYSYKNMAFLIYDCEDINEFYRVYGEKEVTKKWNALVLPWLQEAPVLDGSADVATLTKIMDVKHQLEFGTVE